MKNSLPLFAILFFAMACGAGAQMPTGFIAGVVRDPSGALVAGARVQAVSLTTGLVRSRITPLKGEYSFPSLMAGTKDAQGCAIPRLTVPANYSFGDNFQAVDLRLTRVFTFREHWRLSVIGEVFNLCNAANPSGYASDLTSPSFGQPTSRANRVFGSGGPRAFQLALRVRI